MMEKTGVYRADFRAAKVERRRLDSAIRQARWLQSVIISATAFSAVLLLSISMWAVWVFLIASEPPTLAQREAVGPVLVSGGTLLVSALFVLVSAYMQIRPRLEALELQRELLDEAYHQALEEVRQDGRGMGAQPA